MIAIPYCIQKYCNYRHRFFMLAHLYAVFMLCFYDVDWNRTDADAAKVESEVQRSAMFLLFHDILAKRCMDH